MSPRTVAATLAALLTAAASAQPQTATPPGFTKQTASGFTLYVADAVPARTADGRLPAVVLEQEFDDLRRVLPPALFKLLQGVPVFVQWDKAEAGHRDVLARYFGATREQMKQFDRPEYLSNAVEILQLKRIGELRRPGTQFQQIITLHEMAHAIHHRRLGWDDAEVEAAYKQAMDRKLYDRVADRTNRLAPAYARTNAKEYFAELTCAYLDTCHSYPFTYTDLRHHDPAGFALMERVYKGGPPSAATAMAVAAAPAATGSGQVMNVYAERDAMVKLDGYRKLARDGKPGDARAGYAEVVRLFPNTYAAREAKGLLGQ